MKPKNGTLKKSLVLLGAGLLVAFVGFTVHKIYIGDPRVYAEKANVEAFVIESRADRASTKSLATENKEAIND